MLGGMTFEDCVRETLRYPDFLPQYDRLMGTTFSQGGVEALIDRATGKFEQDAHELFEFIHEYIWSRA